MNHFLEALWSDESGQDLVEYVLILVLIAIAAVVGLTALGTEVNNAFDKAQSQVKNGLS